MIHFQLFWFHPYSQSWKLLQLKLSNKILKEKRGPNICIMMHLKHQHMCNKLSRWLKDAYLCQFCLDKEITVIYYYRILHSFVEKHTVLYVILYIFQLPLLRVISHMHNSSRTMNPARENVIISFYAVQLSRVGLWGQQKIIFLSKWQKRNQFLYLDYLDWQAVRTGFPCPKMRGL